MSTSLLNGMSALKPLDTSSLLEGTLAVSLIIPAKNSSHTLEVTVVEAYQFLSQRYPGSFEILLVPNPTPGDREDESTLIAEKMAP